MGWVLPHGPHQHFEAITFSEGLSHYRDLLEPGAALMLQLQASTEGEDVRARIQTCEPLDQAASRHQKGMRIYLRDERPISSVQQRLRARGEVSLILILDGGEREVEVKLGGSIRRRRRLRGGPGGAGGGAGGGELRGMGIYDPVRAPPVIRLSL
jgi:DNA polymerase-3 subunit alpha